MSNDVLNAWAPTSESVLSGAVTVQVIDNEATEGLADPGVFRVSRPESATNGALTVYFALGGSAVNSRDYAAVGGSIVIPEGQASVDVEIAPIEDLDLAEGDETVTLTLAPGSYIIGTPSSVNLTVHDSGALDQFAHRSPFVFTGHRSAETLTNFPALVLLGTNVNDFSYSDLLSGKYNDLRFTDESMTGFLNYEVESWTTNSLSQIWVQVPALTNGTTIWAHWGQSGMTAPAYTTNGATWANNYLAVYHLAETSGPVRDSSPYGNGLSLNGDIQQGTAGYVGAAATWPDTSNDWLQRPVNDSLQGMGQLTLQTWFYDQQNDISARGLISKRSSQTSQVSYYLFKYQNKNLWCFLNNNPSTGGGEFTNTVTGANSWNLAAFTYDRNLGTSRMKAYLNGDYRSSRNDVSGNVPITTSALHIGILNANYGSCFKGRMDEVRISSTARSAEWIKAEYLNMSSNSLFQIYPGPMPSLFVDSYPQQYAGAVPSYGSTNLIGGEVFSCTVPEFVDVDVGVRYACAGYLLYSNLVELARSDTVNSCIYTNSGGADRLIWQWKPQSYVTFTNSGPGTVSIPGGWYDVGAQVACTAVVGGAAQFIGWDDPQGLLLTPPAFSNSLAGVIQPAILTATFISSFNSAGWPNRMSIRFDGYDKSETLTNFPVMVTFSNTLAGCFYYADMASPADAGDLRFTAGDGTTELFYDIEKWNTNGTSTLWVRLPQLSADNNRIFAFWGNPAQVEPPLYTGNGLTWANGFVAVYHLAEESGAVKDSSPYGNGLTVYNNVQQGVNGIVGPSARWPIAGTDWMEGPASDSLQGMGELTLQTWFYDELSDGEARGLISKRQDINTDRSYYLFKYQNNNLWWYIGGSGGQFSNTATTANRWYFASATYDKNLSSGRMKIYLDGEFRSSSSYASGDVPVFDSTLCLGMLNANYTRSFNGQMDEVRISRAARSPDWIWAEYMNVKNSDLFQSYARSSVGTIIVVR
jgi:hypothetical protein